MYIIYIYIYVNAKICIYHKHKSDIKHVLGYELKMGTPW